MVLKLLTQICILLFLDPQLPSPACTLIGRTGPCVQLAVEGVHRRGHENAPSLRTPRAVWTALLWGPRWKQENAMLFCAQVQRKQVLT